MIYVCISNLRNYGMIKFVKILVQCRDGDDHVKWLLQHGFHEKALAAVEEGKAKPELLEEVWISVICFTQALTCL